MSVTRCRPPLGQIVFGTLNHATCDVYLTKAVETLIQGKCYVRILVPLMCVKKNFSVFPAFVLYIFRRHVRVDLSDDESVFSSVFSPEPTVANLF